MRACVGVEIETVADGRRTGAGAGGGHITCAFFTVTHQTHWTTQFQRFTPAPLNNRVDPLRKGIGASVAVD